MRYIRLKDKKGDIHLGAFMEKGKLFYLDEIFPELKGRTLIDFIEMMDGDPEKAAQSICAANAGYHTDDGISLLAPIEHGVHDILCVGVNYSDHLAETKEHLAGALSDDFSGTVYFGKRASRILGPDVLTVHDGQIADGALLVQSHAPHFFAYGQRAGDFLFFCRLSFSPFGLCLLLIVSLI